MRSVFSGKEATDWVEFNKKMSKTIGFVPTMGALHEGHLSLIRRCKTETDLTVCSIFVNPTQFNDAEDFKKYPKTPEEDQYLLEKAGVDLLFMPTKEEMYPTEPDFRYDFGFLERTMEGVHRPGHFKGVGMIVQKLFEIVKPEISYFGEKDFQQLTIIKELVRLMNSNIKVIGCPTLREPSGLAMSSRNKLLSPEQRKIAEIISQTLFWAQSVWHSLTPAEITHHAIQKINYNPAIRCEYFEIAETETLRPVTEWTPGISARAFIAAKIGNVRLIDNMEV